MTKTQKKQRQHEGDDEIAANDVRLVGRLTAEPVVVELPSGDSLVTFRVSVQRGAARGEPRCGDEDHGPTGRLGAVHGVDARGCDGASRPGVPATSWRSRDPSGAGSTRPAERPARAWRSRRRRPGSCVGQRPHDRAQAGLRLEGRGLLRQEPARLDERADLVEVGARQQHRRRRRAGGRQGVVDVVVVLDALRLAWQAGQDPVVQPGDRGVAIEVARTDRVPRRSVGQDQVGAVEGTQRSSPTLLLDRGTRRAGGVPRAPRAWCRAACGGSLRGTGGCRPGRPAWRVRRPMPCRGAPAGGGGRRRSDGARRPGGSGSRSAARRCERSVRRRGWPRCVAADPCGRGSATAAWCVSLRRAARAARRRRGARGGSVRG